MTQMQCTSAQHVTVMMSCEMWRMHVSAQYYQSAMVFLILFILCIAFCLRLLIVVTVIHHIIYWVQHKHTQKLIT